MCISRKGSGYDPINAVTTAVAKCGWTPKKFFSCAEQFAGNKKNGFNAKAAADEFNNIRMNRPVTPEHMVSPTAVVFADWVFIKDVKVIQERFHSY